MGVPKPVRAADGSSATITLTRVRYLPKRDGIAPPAVFNFTIVGTSEKHFKWDDLADVAEQDGTRHDLYAGDLSDQLWYSQNGGEDYTGLGQPIVSASVRMGQTVKDVVMLRIWSKSDYILRVTDEETNALADWVLHSTGSDLGP